MLDSYNSCLYCLITVSYQHHLFNIQQLRFAHFAVGDMDYFGIYVILSIFCIFAYEGGQ